MQDLLLSEWRRFRRTTLVASLVHLLALLLMSRLSSPLQWPHEDQFALLALYMLLGLVLGLVQLGGYRRTGQWLWLIHRPLPMPRIFVALAAAALLMIGAAIVAPLLVYLAATDVFTTRVVDSRHYAALLHVAAFAWMAWLAGALAMLSRHKAVVAVLVAPLLLALHLVSAWVLLLPVAVCVAWLTWITLHAFRADRAAPIARTGVLLLTALPLQLGFYLLLYHVGNEALHTWRLVSHPPVHTEIATSMEEFDDVMRKMSVGMLVKGLQDSSDARAAEWREQLPLLETAGFAPDIDRFPVRHQLGNPTGVWWDEQQSIEWTFSHDRMQYLGRDPRNGETRGAWGPQGADDPEPFATMPLQQMTRDTLYAVDDAARRQHVLYRLPHGEWFVGRPNRALDRVMVLTSERLLALRRDPRAATPYAPLLLDWQVTLPDGATHLAGVDVAELLDGWLVSLFHYDAYERFVEPWQQVVHIDANANVTVVAERRNVRDVQIQTGSGGSPALPTESWWLSPPLHVLASWPATLFDNGATRPQRFDPVPDVPALYPLAAIAMLLSLVLGHAWLRRTNASRSRCGVWLASCALLGPPALLSLLCLEPRTAR